MQSITGKFLGGEGEITVERPIRTRRLLMFRNAAQWVSHWVVCFESSYHCKQLCFA